MYMCFEELVNCENENMYELMIDELFFLDVIYLNYKNLLKFFFVTLMYGFIKLRISYTFWFYSIFF